MKRELAAFAVLAIVGTGMAKPMLVINEDNDHYFKLDASLMTESALKDYAYDIFRGPVTHFFMCPQGQRASYASKVWEPIWAGLDEPDRDGKTNNIWCVNAKNLHDAGINPYNVWITCAREKGVSPWMSMRMNDVHFCTISNYFRNTTFWKTRVDLRRSGQEKGQWELFCFDYAKKEVRDYHLAMAKELIDMYDVDGLELDWLRFMGYFKPGRARSDAHFLTEFISDVRRHADEVGARRGRRIALGVRVAAMPEGGLLVGLDPVDWAAKGLVDLVVVCNNHMQSDFNIPFREWKARLKAVAPSVKVLPGTDHKYGCGVPRQMQYMTAELYRGWADSLIAQGADGLYLFNMPYNTKAIRDEIYGKGLSPKAVRAGSRRYLVTRHDTLPRGGIPCHCLPQKVSGGTYATLQIGTPASADGTCEVVVGFDVDDPALAGAVTCLNGEASAEVPRRIDGKTLGGKDRPCAVAYAYRFPVGVCVAGANAVSMKAMETKASLTWCEMRIK